MVGEAINRHVRPVMLFPFHDEIVLETGSIWLEVAGLRDDVNQQSPSSRLRRVAQGTYHRFFLLVSTADRRSNNGCKAREVPATNGNAAMNPMLMTSA